MPKYRITSNGVQFHIEEKNALNVWKNRFSFHFNTHLEAKAKITELERHDAEKRHEWTVVED